MNTVHKLYGGEVELAFDPVKHRYTANGRPCPGVTGILSVINKPAIGPWMVKQACESITRSLKPGVAYDEVEIKRIVEEARRAHRVTSGEASDVGKIAHKFAEEWIASLPDGAPPPLPVNKQAREACASFLDWLEANHVQPQFSERVVYSRKHHYAGTVDFVGTVNGRYFVCDFKTSSGLYDEMRFQVSAYKLALLEEGAIQGTPPGRMILRFAKDGSGFHVHELPPDEDERDTRAFLAALELSSIINQAKAQKEAA